MVSDFTEFLDLSATEIYEDWLDYITTRDPLLQDRGPASFLSILAEAVASEFWIFLQLLKQKVQDSSVLTAEGDALSAIVLSYLPEGRQAGTRATGTLIFGRSSAAPADITIPAGTIAAALAEDGSLLEFATDAVVVLEAGETQVYTAATAIVVGEDGNVTTGAISITRTPVVGISTVTNDSPFINGTDEESDEDLRTRALYTIWVNGKATIPLMQEHINGVDGVRETLVETLGQGDVLLVIDNSSDEDDIDEMIRENLAAGCTAPGVLGASLRDAGDTFGIGDTAGAPVWVRTLQFCSAEVVVPFIYQEPGGTSQNGSATIPAGSPAGYTIEATMAEGYPNAVAILSSAYADSLSFDLFMGIGTYPRLWVPPTLKAADINLVLVLTSTPEVGLLGNVRSSLMAKLDSYQIGEELQFADLIKHIYVDYETNRLFSGVDDIAAFEITCNGETISLAGGGGKIVLDDDSRVEPGTVSVTEAA